MTQPRHCLSDAKWALIEPHIPPRKGRPGGDARLFLDALLWIGTTGSPWRDLPVFSATGTTSINDSPTGATKAILKLFSMHSRSRTWRKS